MANNNGCLFRPEAPGRILVLGEKKKLFPDKNFGEGWYPHQVSPPSNINFNEHLISFSIFRAKFGNKIICRIRPANKHKKTDEIMFSKFFLLHKYIFNNNFKYYGNLSSPSPFQPNSNKIWEIEEQVLIKCSRIGSVLATNLLTSSQVNLSEARIISTLANIASISYDGNFADHLVGLDVEFLSR